MAIASYHLFVKSQSNKHQIYLRVTSNRKKSEFATGIYLDNVKEWNVNSESIRKSKYDSIVLNDRLEKLKTTAKKAEDILKQNDEVITSKSIISILRKLEDNTFYNQTKYSFISYAESYIQKTLEKNYWTSTKQYTLLNKLKCFLANCPPKKCAQVLRGRKNNEYISTLHVELEFKDITYTFLNEFKQYLQKMPNCNNPKVTLNPNTIKKNFEVFRTIYLAGVDELEEKGLSLARNPFSKLKLESVDPLRKEKLTDEEIERIKALQLEKHSIIWDARNCFLFAFYCAGIRAGDSIALRRNNIHKKSDGTYRLEYTMEKTHKKINIEILPEALEILSYYVDFNKLNSKFIFPFLGEGTIFEDTANNDEIKAMSVEQKKAFKKRISSIESSLNKQLAKIASMAGIEKKITTHIARHSFADKARKQDASTTDIKGLMGHSTVKMTENYLNNFDLESQDNTLKRVFANKSDTNKIVRDLLKNLSKEEINELLNNTY